MTTSNRTCKFRVEVRGTTRCVRDLRLLDAGCYADGRDEFWWRARVVNDAVLAAIRDGKRVGYVVVQCEGDRLRVTRLGVAPAYRRQGVASALLRRVCAEFGVGDVVAVVPQTGDFLPSHLWLKSMGLRGRIAGAERYEFAGTVAEEPA